MWSLVIWGCIWDLEQGLARLCRVLDRGFLKSEVAYSRHLFGLRPSGVSNNSDFEPCSSFLIPEALNPKFYPSKALEFVATRNSCSPELPLPLVSKSPGFVSRAPKLSRKTPRSKFLHPKSRSFNPQTTLNSQEQKAA